MSKQSNLALNLLILSNQVIIATCLNVILRETSNCDILLTDTKYAYTYTLYVAFKINISLVIVCCFI